MGTRKFTKVNERVFKVEETKTFKNTIDTTVVFKNLANGVNKMKEILGLAAEQKSEYQQAVKWYNDWVQILIDANDAVKLAIKIPEFIKLPEVFKIDDVDIEKLPKIDIKAPEPVVEVKKGGTDTAATAVQQKEIETDKSAAQATVVKDA